MASAAATGASLAARARMAVTFQRRGHHGLLPGKVDHDGAGLSFPINYSPILFERREVIPVRKFPGIYIPRIDLV